MSTLIEMVHSTLGLWARPDDLTFAQIGVRALLVYGTLIALVRFGKKRFLGQATAFDAILLILIGSIASRAVSGTAPFFPTLFAVGVLIAIHSLISYVSCVSTGFGRLIKGNPTVLIKDGRVHSDALRRAHMTAEDLEEDLRKSGVRDPAEISEARLERDGKLSVLKIS
jgi:uncharacterized membrane protein YcaP (DUF421 family)